jgi:hypothetical protein
MRISVRRRLQSSPHGLELEDPISGNERENGIASVEIPALAGLKKP